MTSIFMKATFISIIYLIIRFFERKIFQQEDDEPFSLKLLIKEGLMVYLSVVIGFFAITNITSAMETVDEQLVNPKVFTNMPDW